MSTDEEFMETREITNGREPNGFVLIRSDPCNPWAKLECSAFGAGLIAYSDKHRRD
jgi:hypothetical protein